MNIEASGEILVNDDFCKDIGKVVVYFNFLEQIISLIIWHFIGKDQQFGQVITAELPFKGLLKLLGSLSKCCIKDTKQIEKLDDLIKRAFQAEEKRNNVVHSIWGQIDQENVKRIKITAKQKGRNVQSDDVSIEKLEEIIEILSKLIGDFFVFQLVTFELDDGFLKPNTE